LRVSFPRTKDEIERFIVESFAKGPIPGGFVVQAVRKNKENDFDFSIDSSHGRMYLELMEVAPLEALRGSYEQAPSSYNAYDLARFIHGKVMAKSQRYVGVKNTPVALLLYITNWTFTLSETSVALLQFWMAMQLHAFKYAFAHHPVDESGGRTSLVFPTPVGFWKDFDPERLRENVVHNISPHGWRFDSEAG
jgi:hypothetical protein